MFAIKGRATRNFLLVLCIMYFILYVDRVNLAAAAGAIQKDLGLSNTELGVAFFRRSIIPMRRSSSSAAGSPTAMARAGGSPSARWSGR